MPKITIRKSAPLPEGGLEHTSVLQWWSSSVVEKDGFFDVMDQAERDCPIPPGASDDSQRTIYNLAFREGWRLALRHLATIAEANQKSTPTPEFQETYSNHIP